MKRGKRWIAATLTWAMMASPLATFAQSQPTPTSDAIKASNELMEKEAIRLIIFASVLSSKGYDIVEVSPNIERRYNNARNAVFATLPTTSATVGLGYLAKQSAETFESVLRPITIVLRQIAQVIAESGKASVRFLDKIGVDVLIESSGKSLEASADALKPLIKLLVSKGFVVSVGTISMAGVVATSSFFISNSTVEGALDSKVAGGLARQVLGYDREVQQRVDSVTDDLASIFTLDANQKAKFKEAFMNELVSLALQNNFDPSKEYNVDVLKILSDQKLITSELSIAADALKELVRQASENRITKVSDQEKLAANIDAVIAVSAILEEIIESQKLGREDEKEVALRLINAQKNLELVKLNFKGL